MKKTKFSHKVIAVFLTLNFLTTIIPINQLFANNNGPGSPEAAGFEPVDATDMVNLTTGDLSYVLPLMSVEGFPVNLSYHAGMTMDMDASWAGLGWYLNPGAINRSVTNTPDDWKAGTGINFNSFYNETDYYGVTVEVGLPGAASVGVGLNWGGGQGLSGSVNANLGLGAATGGMIKGGVSASVSTTGDASLGYGYGVQIGSFGVGASVSYSLKNQWSLSGSAGVNVGENGFVGSSLSSNGSFSVGGGTKGTKGDSGGAGMSSDSFSQGDASIDTQSTGIAVPLIVLPITIGFRKTKVKINVRKGFLNQEWGALYANDYDYSLNNNSALIYDVYNYNELFKDYATRTNSIDTYSTRLPQPEEDFIGDYSKAIENINFTFMGYDSYNVAAQGLMGNMTPHVFQNATIFGKGQRTKNEGGDDIHVFWHHGLSGNEVKRQLGRLDETSTAYNNNDFYFNFDGQFTSIEKNDANGIVSNIDLSDDINDLIYEGNHSGTSNSYNNSYYGRAKSPNYVEVFTNAQIANGHAALRGLITPSTIPDLDRVNTAKFDPDGIGAYMITSPDGKTYHFSLPVYHFEQVQRGQINKQENSSFNIQNVTEKRQYSRYATHWLLTAVTGSDYVDRPDPDTNNSLKSFNKEDYGYWVELEYGKWSDGYVWRTPYQDRVYQYNTNIKGDIEKGDKGGYSFGRKQLYYLDKINTKNKTALFVKDIRFDAIGKNLKFQYNNATNMINNVFTNGSLTTTNNDKYLGNTGHGSNQNSLKYTNPYIDVREYKLRSDGRRGVEYDREYSLKLSKIVLVDGDVGKNLSKNTVGSLGTLLSPVGYVPNDTCIPNWESDDFVVLYGSNYTYPIHNEQDVLDVNDVSQSFIDNNALKVVELKHSYELAKSSPSSMDINIANNPNSNYGRLTLESVQIKGKGGTEYMPATSFNYYLEDMPNISLEENFISDSPDEDDIRDYVNVKKNSVDSWGYLQGEAIENGITHNKIKAWSLKEITMPTGAKIEIDYEEDEYWMEAFARRYWYNEFLSFKLYENSGQSTYGIEIGKDPDMDLTDDFNFNDYFHLGQKTSLDLWISRIDADFSGILNCIRRRGHIDILPENALDVNVTNVSNDVLFLSIPKNQAILTGSHTSKVFNKMFTRCNHVVCQNDKVRGEQADGGGLNCEYDHHVLQYRLLANKIPENENGGGLRVSELRTKDIGNTYKVTYDYNHPTENRSSGITSYAPVDGLKYVPYQSEIPAPGVMYEYVTMKETSNTGDYYSKTRYRHHVLKPVFNIFNPNIEMEALDANAPGEDNIFWANVQEDYGGLNGVNSRDVEAKKIDININSALIGQLKSIENLNSEGHVMFKTENEYINGTRLVSQEPNKGYVKETFNSMKTVFKTNNDGTVINDEKRLLSISSKTEYNNMLKKTITTGGGQKSSIEYSDVDPWLSSFRKSETTMADGTKMQDIRIPAYTEYADMGSKVTNPSNKNMLTQEAMNISSVLVGGQWKTTNAYISTWNDTWNHVTNNGQTNTIGGLWRKHQSFVWKDAVDTDGTYGQLVDANDFNWGIGATQTNTEWQKVSEITKYNLWSSPVESVDINGNFAASKMADNFSKVTASGNARYTEMYYSGAEYVDNGNMFEGEVLGANYRTSEYAHTGNWSVKNISTSDKVFEINKPVSTSTTTNTLRPGKYKVSFWVKNRVTGSPGVQLTVNGSTVEATEGMLGVDTNAGNWQQYIYYITIPTSATNLNLDVKATNSTGNYFDDFRMHPIASSMNSYVYNQETDELIAVLGANNLATVYCYDLAGRLCTVYTEIVGKDNGGFKKISKNIYNYKGMTSNDSCDCLNLETPINPY
ncbi:hypothetical protein [Pontimicrobium sp. SW4]|uniref:CBM6 domain-containing protein n=1 Tax=Pontimicrobium sp. SW4 TaxID=3153519 RepID=A0AAU7BPR9_9FLAO